MRHQRKPFIFNYNAQQWLKIADLPFLQKKKKKLDAVPALNNPLEKFVSSFYL
jgi:hypothetical protein